MLRAAIVTRDDPAPGGPAQRRPARFEQNFAVVTKANVEEFRGRRGKTVRAERTLKLLPTSSSLANQARRGFTLTDLLVAVACLSVLGAFLLAEHTRARMKARLDTCTCNLAQVTGATLAYVNDHHQCLPASDAADKHDLWWWYKEKVKSYAGLHGESSNQDTLFACPEDRGYSEPTPFCQNARFDFSSYVFNGVTLAGDAEYQRAGVWRP